MGSDDTVPSGDERSGTTREEFLKRAGAAGAAVSASSLLAACGSSGSDSKGGTSGGAPDNRKLRTGGNMRIGLGSGSTADLADPHRSNSAGDATRQFALFNQLTNTRGALDANSGVKMELAEEMEPNKTGDEWTIRLRDGVEFHNGKTLDVDDIIYTHGRITDPKTGSVSFARWSLMDMKAAKKLDKRTLRVPLASPNFILRELLGQTSSAGIIPVGFDLKKPIGTGPFKLKDFDPGRQTVLDRFDNFYGEKAKADTLTLVVLTDDTARYNALTSGQIDVLDQLPLTRLRELKANAKYTVSSLPTAQWSPIYMRVDKAPFDDVRVRQALRLSLDRQRVIDSAFSGQARVGNDVFGLFDPFRDESLVREQDVEQAKSLLKQAGQENLTVELVTGPVNVGAVEACQVLASSAKDAGITVKLRQVDLGTIYGPNYTKWPFSIDTWPGFGYLVQTASWSQPQSPVNITHQNDPKYDSLYKQALSQGDDEKRRELVQELQKIDFERGGAIIPAFSNYTAAYTTDVGGFYTANLDGNAIAAGYTDKLGFVA